MDGLLLVDKPAGPTSHDVVARMRRVLRERRIGHTGTLDPAATGLLPLVIGRATRLARFLSSDAKTYETTIRLGASTDSGDAHGLPIGTAHTGPLPSPDEVVRALDGFRGTFLQQPPAFSARRIAGERSYRLARRARRENDRGVDPIRPAATRVTVDRIAMIGFEAPDVTLVLSCSAGFYVRSFAHDLGQRLGTGAHLTALRRTRAGPFALDRAIELAAAERDPERALAALIPMPEMMPGWSAMVLTADGVRHARSGRDLGPSDFRAGSDAAAVRSVRLMDDAGELVGIAEPADTPGLLHPSVVLM